MARVDADTHAVLGIDEVYNVPQILPRRPDDVAAARHVLDDRHHGLCLPVGLVELSRDAPYSGGPGVAEGRARVEVVEPDAQLLAPLQVVEKGLVRLGRLGRVRLRQVDEVGPVREGVLGGAVAVVPAAAKEEVARLVADGRVVPLALRLEEEGKGVGANLHRVRDRVVDACRGGERVRRRSHARSAHDQVDSRAGEFQEGGTTYLLRR